MIRRAVLLVSVTLMGLSLTWSFLGMRAVMDIGGACASGGPYVPVQQCPESATALLSGGIPLLVLSTLLASGVALTLSAPTLLLPLWVALFGSFGWNFLEYAFAPDDGIVIGWLIPGIMFELMAFPAAVWWIAGATGHLPSLGSRPTGAARWWLAYAVTGTVGIMLGWWTFDSWT